MYIFDVFNTIELNNADDISLIFVIAFKEYAIPFLGPKFSDILFKYNFYKLNDVPFQYNSIYSPFLLTKL
jgi:hypothetical protein